MFKIIAETYRKTFERKFNVIAILGIIAISTLFGLLCVIAFWNPQENLKDLPVAVVNLDKGSTGQEIVDNLKDNDSVKWETTDKNIFADGIENTDYFFAFLIPEDFSEKVASGNDGEPDTAEIYYYSDQRKNYILAQLSSMVKYQFTTNISNSVTEEYVIAAFDNLYRIKDGLSDAQKGSNQLYSGSQTLLNGTNKLTSGLSTLSSGADKLNSGSNDYTRNMKSFNTGVEKLTKGTSELNSNSILLSNSINELSTGAGKINTNIQKLSGGLATANQTYSDGMDKMMASYENIMNSNLSSDQKLERINTLMSQVDGAYDSYMTNMKTIQTGISSVAAGSQTLDDGISKLNNNTVALKKATQTINKGAKDISAASNSLTKASNSLASGASSLASGASTAKNSSLKISSGSNELSKGIDSLDTGLYESYSKLNQNLVTDSDDMGSFLSDPVETSNKIYGDVDNYGSGFAPLFMSLGLWLGALMLFFVIDTIPADSTDGNRFRFIIGKYLTVAPFALLEALVISGTALLIGIHVTNIPAFILFTMCASLTFVAIIQCFHVVFGYLVSKAASVIMIVLQISAGGGTFPVELCGGFFTAIHPFLPFSYTIDGFREIISGGNITSVLHNAGVLLLFFFIFITLSLLFYNMRKFRRENPLANQPLS